MDIRETARKSIGSVMPAKSLELRHTIHLIRELDTEIWAPAFTTYLAKKRAEGKNYNIAISHAAKKLVRLIFALEKSGKSYRLSSVSGGSL